MIHLVAGRPAPRRLGLAFWFPRCADGAGAPRRHAPHQRRGSSGSPSWRISKYTPPAGRPRCCRRQQSSVRRRPTHRLPGTGSGCVRKASYSHPHVPESRVAQSRAASRRTPPVRGARPAPPWPSRAAIKAPRHLSWPMPLSSPKRAVTRPASGSGSRPLKAGEARARCRWGHCRQRRQLAHQAFEPFLIRAQTPDLLRLVARLKVQAGEQFGAPRARFRTTGARARVQHARPRVRASASAGGLRASARARGLPGSPARARRAPDAAGGNRS